MNVISEEPMWDVLGALNVEGGWALVIFQDDRWAWNSDSNAFEKQHGAAATSPDGILGRKHVRVWEFGGYVSGSAHVDSSIPHHATSFDDAEQAIEEIFDQAADWEGLEDYYDLDNGGLLDHDGYATDLWRWRD